MYTNNLLIQLHLKTMGIQLLAKSGVDSMENVRYDGKSVEFLLNPSSLVINP